MKLWILIVFVMGQPEYGADQPFATKMECERAGAEWDARKQSDQMPHVCIPMEKNR